jgi:protein phosphatase
LIGKRTINDGERHDELKLPFFIAVADGVSGETSGEVASELALGVLAGIKPSAHTNFENTALSIHKFLKMQGSLKDKPNMQTTLCACAFFEGKSASGQPDGVIINVGDSRAYLWRGGKLLQLTRDQSLAQLLYETGQLTKSERAVFAHRNIILPALGNLSADPSPDITKLPKLAPGDVILMCTDGFSDYVPADDAEYILALPERLQSRIKKLCDRALMGGSKDNITIVGALIK